MSEERSPATESSTAQAGCECIERINEHWATQGIPAMVQTSRILSGIGAEHEVYSTRIAIGAWKTDRGSRKRPPALIAQFCPMCGTRYLSDDAARPPAAEGVQP